MKQTPLPKPLVAAAQRISTTANQRMLSFTKVRELVSANPAAVWHEYATFHVEKVITWEDGREDKEFVATLNGCEMALHEAACLMLVLRGQEQTMRDNPHVKIRHRYRVVLAVPNNVNGLHAWLDCETGKLETGRGWPVLVAALTAG